MISADEEADPEDEAPEGIEESETEVILPDANFRFSPTAAAIAEQQRVNVLYG